MAATSSPFPHLHFPSFIITQSLQSSIPPHPPNINNAHGIVSILISADDLAKLHLSPTLQLFPVHHDHAPSSLPPTELPHDSNATALHGSLNKHPPSHNLHQHARDDSFSFPTPMLLSPDVDLSSAGISLPIFKSRGVIQAEDDMADNSATTTLGTPGGKRKTISMDELTFNQQIGYGSTELAEGKGRTSMKAQDDSAMVTSTGQSRLRARVPLPALEISRPELEEKADTLRKKHAERILNRTLSRVSGEARIDLKASPAAKFLLQVMPWELTPSPVTPAKAPAAIPFFWEEAPGKPKRGGLPSPFPTLQLPPRLAVVRPRITDELVFQSAATSSSPPRHRKNSHSWHFLQSLFPGNRHSASQENQSHEQPLNSPIRLSAVTTSLAGPKASDFSSNSCNRSDVGTIVHPQEKPPTDYQIPSPYVATFTPLTSPYRDLGPTENELENGHKGAMTGKGLKAFLRKIPNGRTTHPKKKRRDIPRTEPWAPTLVTYFHKWKHHRKDATESSDSCWGDGEEQYRRGEGFYQERESSTNAATGKELGGGTARLGARRAGRQRRSKHKWIFRRLRRSVRLFVAMCKAIRRSILLSRKASGRKLLSNSKLQYQSLHSQM